MSKTIKQIEKKDLQKHEQKKELEITKKNLELRL